jgi:uncharacterized Zn finger protein
MKTQINLKCPRCGESIYHDIKLNRSWKEPTAYQCLQCKEVFVYTATATIKVEILKLEKQPKE